MIVLGAVVGVRVGRGLLRRIGRVGAVRVRVRMAVAVRVTVAVGVRMAVHQVTVPMEVRVDVLVIVIVLVFVGVIMPRGRLGSLGFMRVIVPQPLAIAHRFPPAPGLRSSHV
jgi:hypothetical protein